MTPDLAHYGVTVAEAHVPTAELTTAAPGGAAADGLAFLGHLGFELLHTNLYPDVGRQWILGRGRRGAPGYIERDLFTSFRADAPRAGDDTPRAGDAIFRLTVEDPAQTVAELRARGWAEPYLGSETLLRGPDAALYEIASLTGDAATDRTVAVWTDPARRDEAAATWGALFGFECIATDADYHGVATATVLRRGGDGAMTLQLLVPPNGAPLAVRLTDDIFAQQGYAHFRLGTHDKDAVRAVGETVFPDTGDVSCVMIEGAYLELVELADVPVAAR